MNIKNKQIAIVIIALISILTFTSCENKIKGEGESLVFTPIVSDFESIDLSLAADVTITYSDVASLTVEAQSNIYDNLEITVSKGILYIEEDKNVGSHIPVKLSLQMPTLKSIDISGACYVDVTSEYASTLDMYLFVSGDNDISFLDSISCNSFNYNVSGSSSLNAVSIIASENFEVSTSGTDNTSISHLQCQLTKYNVSGYSDVRLKGSAVYQEISVSGSISYDALGLVTSNTSVNISGASNIKLNITDELYVKNSGTTTISYKGAPSITQDNAGELHLIPLE